MMWLPRLEYMPVVYISDGINAGLGIRVGFSIGKYIFVESHHSKMLKGSLRMLLSSVYYCSNGKIRPVHCQDQIRSCHNNIGREEAASMMCFHRTDMFGTTHQA